MTSVRCTIQFNVDTEHTDADRFIAYMKEQAAAWLASTGYTENGGTWPEDAGLGPSAAFWFDDARLAPTDQQV